MIQLVLPNYNIPCYGGLCEGFSEGTVGQATYPRQTSSGVWYTSGVWNNAVYPVNQGETGAWQENYNGGNHPNELPPKGLRVAVFFSLGSTPAGHTAIQLEDGRVASSTQVGYHTAPFIHPSLQDLINTYAKSNNGCEYLGYSEYIGRVKVIEGANMTEDAVRYGYKSVTALDAGQKDPNGNVAYTEDDIRYWTGRLPEDFNFAMYKFSDSFIVARNKQVADLQKQLAEQGYVPYAPPPTYIKVEKKQ